MNYYYITCNLGHAYENIYQFLNKVSAATKKRTIFQFRQETMTMCSSVAFVQHGVMDHRERTRGKNALSGNSGKSFQRFRAGQSHLL